jgi:hypothetical protein
VAFEFKKASSVALGTFNIYIIQPGWLAKVGMLQQEAEMTVEANMSRPGFRLSLPTQKTFWFVSPEKLAIESVEESVDCGQPMADVLAKLPVTPIFGLGNNVVFESSARDADEFPALRACRDLVQVPNGYTKGQQIFAASVVREKRIFTLNVTVQQDVILLSGNAHVQLGDNGTAEMAAPFAARFEDDKRELAELFADVLGVRVNVTNQHA